MMLLIQSSCSERDSVQKDMTQTRHTTEKRASRKSLNIVPT